LGFKVKNSTDDDMTIIIPNTRHDILNIADVTEEIVRMVGIDNIKAVPLQVREVNAINKISYDLIKKNKLRAKAISNNFYETITYIYSSKELLNKYGFETVRDNLDILNPINSDLNTFRTTMFLNHVIAVSNNVKQGFKSVALFENGIVFNKDRNESKITSFIFSGEKEEESLQNSGKSSNIDLFGFGQKLTNIIGKFDLEASTNINDKFFHPYQCANIIQNSKVIGLISKIHPNVAKDFDISDDTYVASINFEDLKDELVSAKDISKFQTSKRDLSIVVPNDLEFKVIKNLIDSLNLPNLVQYNLVDIYNDEKLADNESLTIRFVLQSNDKTLEENDINEIMDTLVSKLEEKLNITLR
jgi:phenylalanyl-tRNA synthetase beta chain